MENLIPSGGAYIFKSGKHQNMSLENVFFTEHSIVSWLKQKRAKYGHSSLGKHLDFVSEAVKYLEVTAMCPHCGINLVENFYLMPGNVVNIKYIACGNDLCHKKVITNHHGYVRLPIDFESLRHLESDKLKDRAVRLFSRLYGLPTHLETETAFDFLKTSFPAPEPEPKKPIHLPKKKKVIQLNLFQF